MTHSRSDNLIDWFQNIQNAEYPDDVQRLLKLLVTCNKPVEILFNVPRWRTFKVLDFKTLEKTRDNPGAVGTYEENYANPFHISRRVAGYEDECNGHDMNGNLLPGETLPFARDIDADGAFYFCFKPADNAVYFMNCANRGMAMEEILVKNVEVLIGAIDDIINEIKDGKDSFHINRQSEILKGLPRIEQFVTEENTFMFEDECIGNAKDYKEIIENLIGITDGVLDPESFSFEVVKNDEVREIAVAINGVAGTLVLKGRSPMVDANLLPQLNKLFGSVMEEKRFVEVYDPYNGGHEGVYVYVDKEIFHALKKHKFIEREEKMLPVFP
jgi:hypothetical protein